MTILHDCEIWFAKVDPKRPNSRFNKLNPTWEVQIRTTSKEKKKEWLALNLAVKDVVPEDGPPYFRVNLRKKSIKVDGDEASPVNVVDGKLRPVEPNSIGNGSIGNVRIFQYEYQKPDGSTGIVSVLMGLQLTKHVVYTPKPRDDEFTETDMEVVDPDDAEGDDVAFQATDEPAGPKSISVGKVF
jgi:hypothetical protein